mmetsp:Transcript_2242/g.5213  ORF Transcript_2242/g.5213 Transcript_2242/m.5213 type:complete len:218 (+) Transcript_2242:103-756(+)
MCACLLLSPSLSAAGHLRYKCSTGEGMPLFLDLAFLAPLRGHGTRLKADPYSLMVMTFSTSKSHCTILTTMAELGSPSWLTSHRTLEWRQSVLLGPSIRRSWCIRSQFICHRPFTSQAMNVSRLFTPFSAFIRKFGQSRSFTLWKSPASRADTNSFTARISRFPGLSRSDTFLDPCIGRGTHSRSGRTWMPLPKYITRLITGKAAEVSKSAAYQLPV